MPESTFLKNHKRLKINEQNFPYNLLDEKLLEYNVNHIHLQKIVVHCN